MYPSSDQPPDLSLPRPTLGEHPPAPVPVEEQLRPPGPAAGQPAPGQGSAMPPLASPIPAAPVGHPLSAAPVAADDSDLIEKEWVEKAKQIVASTQDDPYMQSREVGRFKAEYIKKRYNKDIKLPEAS